MSKTSPSVEPATQPREPELLAGKVAIVTGASRGIGAAAARVFADAGAAVVLAARSQPEIDAIAQHIRSDGGEAVAVATDVTDPIAVQQVVHRAVVAYGRLDAAFNNAGQGHMPVPLAELALEDFDRALAVNARGTFLSMKYEIAAMDRTGGGAIVNMSSSAGLSGAPGMAAYSAAKHGVIGLTKVAALDSGAEGIRVNAVAPGPILTEGGIGAAPAEVQQRVAHLLPLKRLGTPLEVAHAAAWLLSDASSFVNGTTISIDGGKLAGMAGGVIEQRMHTFPATRRDTLISLYALAHWAPHLSHLCATECQTSDTSILPVPGPPALRKEERWRPKRLARGLLSPEPPVGSDRTSSRSSSSGDTM